MPALVNAHTHLELSWLRGRIGPASTFLGWVSGMMRERLQSADGRDEAFVRASMAAALEEMKASGTGLVGDISNSLAHLDVLDASGLDGVVFHELIKFRATDAEGFVDESCRRIEASGAGHRWRLALAPHAPYSVAPSVYRALAAARGRLREARMSVHVAESPEEVEFIGRGSGGWPDLLKRLGAWDPDWRAPRCSPIEYLDRLGFWDERTLAVHAVQAGDVGPRDPGVERRDAGHVPAEQRVGGRGRAAGRGLLPERRTGGHRHRQPDQRRGPQPVRANWRRSTASRPRSGRPTS